MRIAPLARLATLAALLLGATTAAGAQGLTELTWPRTLTAADGMQVTFFQPQVDSWSYYVVLDYHMAVELQLPGASTSVPASLFMTAETSTNLGAQTVAVYNQKIVRMNFPGLDAATAQQYQGIVQSLIPTGTMNLSLPQVQSYVQAAAPAAATAGAPPPAAGPAPRTGSGLPPTLAQPAPPIFYSQSPAILVMFQGPPAFAPVTQGSTLFFSVNTNWAVFQDKSTGTYYLQDQASWLQAQNVNGPWQPAGALPAGIMNLPANDEWADVTKNVPGMSWGPGTVPKVFVSQKPAELILVQGAPQLEAIPGTSLSWVTNTESDLFYYAPTAQWYYLVSGRWFSAGSMQGPWAYATPSLPPDFANIPSDSPRAAVLSSVPGTAEANEAVAQAQMPHKADVDIATATVNVTYGGPPQFSPIPGTSMQYATNTSFEVIQADGNYYVCSNAVWFVSSSPNGPFAVATMVPQVIYTIPPSSPMYNVTYVQIYETTPTTVVVGYTSGYNGAYVAAGVVMLGVGMALAYSYHPYYPPGFGYPVYYHPPYPYTGYGYHAAYNPYTGAYAHGYSAYGPYGGASAGAGYNPTTGTYARGASATGPYGSAAAAQAYNPRTGASAETYQHSNAYGSYGSSTVSKNGETAWTSHSSDAYGTTATAQTSEGGKAAGVSTAYGTTTAGKTANNNEYATHDGNVYKNTGSGWEQGSSSGWSSVDKPPAETSSDAEARSQSEAKSSSYSSWQGGGGSRYSGGSSGGYSGGYHGGGGRR